VERRMGCGGKQWLQTHLKTRSKELKESEDVSSETFPRYKNKGRCGSMPLAEKTKKKKYTEKITMAQKGIWEEERHNDKLG
jgi:hypothetical protein